MTAADPALAQYYAARAREYEQIYAKPERQADLARLRADIPAALAGRDVLEIACGTGYWTEVIAPLARSVTALDINEETLAIARSKPLPAGRVAFERSDVLELPERYRGFTGCFAGFWWSHIRRAARHDFLRSLHRALKPGAVVVLLDNLFVEGNSTPVSHSDAEGNTYQRRQLADGSEHVVLKNFPAEDELRAELAGAAAAFRYIRYEYYWLLEYELAG